MTTLIDFVIAHPEKPWDWYWLSRNPNITMEDVILHPEKPWDWYWLSRNPNITMEDVIAHPEKPWRWDGLSSNPNITMEYIIKHPEKPWSWSGLSMNLMSKGRKTHKYTPYIRAKKIRALIPKLQPFFVECKVIPLQRFVKQVIYSRMNFVMKQRKSTMW
jgi:hypothetical protein